MYFSFKLYHRGIRVFLKCQFGGCAHFVFRRGCQGIVRNFRADLINVAGKSPQRPAQPTRSQPQQIKMTIVGGESSGTVFLAQDNRPANQKYFHPESRASRKLDLSQSRSVSAPGSTSVPFVPKTGTETYVSYPKSCFAPDLYRYIEFGFIIYQAENLSQDSHVGLQ